MQEKIFKIGEGDKQATLAFNLNVMAQIQSEYGSVSAWVELLEDDKENPTRGGEPDMQAFIKGFTFMLNEGVEIENDDLPADKKKVPFTERQVGRLITTWGKDEVQKAMQSAITTATDTGDDTSKNE
jgi:hypothetical protein